MNKLIIAIILLLNLINTAYSKNIYQTHDGEINIKNSNNIYEFSGKLYFTATDNLDYKKIDYDFSKWDLIFSNIPWNSYPKYSNYTGNAWYIIVLNLNNNKDLSLYIPPHYRGAQFYLNGELIYETRYFNKNGITPIIMGKPDFIEIPNNLLKKDNSNIIKIRTGSLRNSGGFDGNIKISSRKNIHKIWIRYVIWYSALAVINLFLTLYFFLIYLNRKNEKYYIYFSGLSFVLGCWIFGYKGLILWVIDSQTAYILLTYLGSLFVPIFLINFIHSFLNLKSNFFQKLSTPIFIILGLFLTTEYFITNDIFYYQKYIYDFFMILSSAIFIYSFLISLNSARKKRIYSKRILLGVSIFTFSFIYSLFDFLDFIEQEPLMIEGFFCMTVVFASVLASRFAQVHTDLEKAHGDLLILDKMKDEFMATISHELKTPLHGIIGISESLSVGDTGNLNKQQKNNVNIILSSARHLSRLVNDILDFSKVKNNKVDLILTKITPEELIDPVISILKVLLEEKNIELKTEFDSMEKITVDKNRIQQVLFNLSENAIKFTTEGEIKISSKKVNNEILISISDTGIGIDPEHFSQIWSPFEQVENANIRTYSGVGLGLAISKELVEMHGGKIWVESQKNTGTTFFFTLPISPNVDALYTSNNSKTNELKPSLKTIYTKGEITHPDQASDNKKDYKIKLPDNNGQIKIKSKKVILAVDDDLTNLQIIVNICKPLGYKVITCRNGFEAIDLIGKNPPDIILLDLMLPKMSGYEICAKVRLYADKLTIPIIMLTARNQLEDMLTGFNSGANDYLTKPFNRQELVARIENQLTIKELFEIEKSLQNALNIYKYIVSTTREHMCFINKEAQFKAANNSFLNALSLNLTDLLDSHINDFIGEGDFWDYLKDSFDKSISGREIHTTNWYTFPNSERKPFEISMVPYRNDSGEIAGVVMNSRDISNQLLLEKEISSISERERRQIGMELHDGICQYLLGIILKTRILSDSMQKSNKYNVEDFREIEGSLKQAVEMTRSLARGAFPVGLENRNLTSMLYSFKEVFEKSSEITINIKTNDEIIIKNLDVLTNLYYIIQESLRNTIKHADAKNIDMYTKINSDIIEILIHNDGKPYGESSNDMTDIMSGGMGLSIMKYRARLIGGKVEIKESKKKRGTDFICSFKNIEEQDS